MRCPHCGKSPRSTDKFCPFCKTELEYQATSLTAQNECFDLLRYQLKEAISKCGGPITVECGKFKASEVEKVTNAQVAAKADWVLTGHAALGELFLTHKATGFCHNGYGSVGTKAFPSRSPYHEPRIWAYAKWARAYCQSNHDTELREGILYWKAGTPRGVWCIPPPDIQNLIVYGPEFRMQDPRYGALNCHVAAIGSPRLEQTDKPRTYRLRFSSGLSSNGEVPGGDDEPILCIASRVGSQKHTYLTSTAGGREVGFAGWVGVFPRRILNSQSPKGRNLEEVKWPGDELEPYLPQKPSS